MHSDNITNNSVKMTDTILRSFEEFNSHLYGDIEEFNNKKNNHLSYKDKNELKRIVTLYNSLQNTGNELNAINIIMNTRYIYDHYMRKIRGGSFIYDNERSNDNSEDDLIFIACVYLSLSIWYNCDTKDKFNDLFENTLNDKYNSYSYTDINTWIINVFNIVDGYIVHPPILDIDTSNYDYDITENENENENENEDERKFTRRDYIEHFISIIIAYRYMSFIRPTIIKKAVSIIIDDILTQTQKQDISSSEINVPVNIDDNNDIKSVHLCCNIIVSYIRNIYKYTNTSNKDMINALNLIVNKLDYSNSNNEFFNKKRRLSGSIIYCMKTPTTTTTTTTTTKDNKKKHSKCMKIDIKQKQVSSYRCIHTIYEKKGCSKVYRGFDSSKEYNKQRYTIKRYTLDYDDNDDENDNNIVEEKEGISENMYSIIREIATIRYIQSFCEKGNYYRSSSISTICDIGFDSNFCYIYMAPNGYPLPYYIKNNLSQYSTSAYNTQISKIIHSMCKALSVCHYYDILHCDIKPENFIFEGGETKLIDFGISECHFSYQKIHTDNIQTMEYKSPELLLGYCDYNSSVDIWALGCSIYEILSGCNIRLFDIKDEDADRCSTNNPFIESRSIQLKIILKRLSLSIYTIGSIHPILKTYPLWHRFQTETNTPPHYDVILKGKYTPIKWLQSNMLIKYHQIIIDCLHFIPYNRPIASELVSRVNSILL